MRIHRAVGWFVLVLGLAVGACRGTGPGGPGDGALPATAGDGGAADPAPGPDDDVDELLELRGGVALQLGDGMARPHAIEVPTDVAFEPLSEEATARLLARLDRLPAEPASIPPFAYPPASLPVPRTGVDRRQTLGPDGSADASAPPDGAPAEPLTILRAAPAGEVPLAATLNVTFSQPMLALGADSVDVSAVPVELSPAIAGQWRWLGTSTPVFEPEVRFPMASRFTLRVPAGTRSAWGGALAADWSQEFATPAPRVTGFHPAGDGVTRHTVHVVQFDQRIDADAVLATIALDDGGPSPALRLASADELAADRVAQVLADATEPGRWLAFVADRSLAAERDVVVRIGPGTPSAEGPRRTDAASEHGYKTHGPLRVAATRCGWRDDCEPGRPFQIGFSHALDPASVVDGTVSVEPALSGMRVQVSGTWITIRGASRAHTRYSVRLDAGLTDVFGQTLVADEVVTFDVGSRAPWSMVDGGHLLVLDPFDAPVLQLRSVNVPSVGVDLRSVVPGDLAEFLAVIDDVRRLPPEDVRPPPGTAVARRTVEPAGDADISLDTVVDLSAAFPQDVGHAVVAVERAGHKPELRWVQRTRLAVDAAVDGRYLLAWVTSLTDGRPVSGAVVRMLGGGGAGFLTDATGLATLPLPESSGSSQVLLAEKAGDTVLLPESRWAWRMSRRSRWVQRSDVERAVVYSFDDRGTYRPGEEAHIKGWVRLVRYSPRGDVRGVPGAAGRPLEWTLVGPRGSELHSGTVALDVFGGFHIRCELPEDMDLGSARVQWKLAGVPKGGESRGQHRLQVAAFRRPEFEVSVRRTDDGSVLVGSELQLVTEARYFAGGGLAAAPVAWTVDARPAAFVPAGWSGWIFGRWVPWWRSTSDDAEADRRWTWAGMTDDEGRHHLLTRVAALDPPRATSLTAVAAITDVNGQQWSASTTQLVHPAQVYVGLQPARTFVAAGQPWPLDVVVVELDGQPVAGRDVRLRAARQTWVSQDGEWVEEERDILERTLTSGDEPVRAVFEPTVAGRWRLSAHVEDGAGRTNATELTFWVSGQAPLPAGERVTQDGVELIPDKQVYAPGDVAEVLVSAPFEGAEGLLTVRRAGLVEHQQFHIEGTSHTLRVPLEQSHMPAVDLAVVLVGVGPRERQGALGADPAPPRPAYAAGSVRLSVPPEQRRLTVTVAPEQRELEPGAATSVDVTVTDANGEPLAGAAVALVVVDEAILALGGHVLGDPLAAFHPPRGAGVRDHRLREFVQLSWRPGLVGRAAGGTPLTWKTVPTLASVGDVDAEADVIEESLVAAPPAGLRELGYLTADGAARKQAGAGAEDQPIDLRTDFAALALFAADEWTDAQGRVRVELTLPDSLTRYRAYAVAVDGNTRAGTGESTLTARLPLMLRPSPPRFLNVGDACELPVVIQNGTDTARSVDVALAASRLELSGAAGRRVVVPANDRVELRWPAQVTSPGEVEWAVVAAASDADAVGAADAARSTLPVWTPATAESFAAYGELDEGATLQPIELPPGHSPFGGLTLTTSSTAMAALTDAVLAVSRYPYGCAEQRASRVLSVTALSGVLDAFRADGLPPAEQLRAGVAADIDALVALQNDDGGFGFWRRGATSHPFVGAHVVHALLAAQSQGWAVPADSLGRGLAWLDDFDAALERWGQTLGAPVSAPVVASLRAHALWVQSMAGVTVSDRARELLASHDLQALPLEAVGWLLAVLAADPMAEDDVAVLLAHVGNRVSETASTAHFVTHYSDGEHLLLHGERRTDGVLLDALLSVDPSSELVTKVVRGLLAGRRAGHWGSTQENAFVLRALARAFTLREADEPAFEARAWLGERSIATQAFVGRTTDRWHLDVPMTDLRALGEERGQPLELVVAKHGPGRLYWRAGLRTLPDDLSLPAAEAGFAVTREYVAVDDPSDVRRDADGVWHVRRGATLRVSLAFVAPGTRHHVALVDRLPAGLEPLDESLAITAPSAPAPGTGTGRTEGSQGLRWAPRSWVVHENLRDDRVEAFALTLGAGVYRHEYRVRATTPGRFVVPAARVEEMYAPETFGRTATATLVVH